MSALARRLLAAWLFLAAGVAGAREPDPEVRHHVEQAQLFVRRGWYADAQAELEAAIATEAGAASYEAHWLLAQVRYERLDALGAAEAARAAAELAEDPRQTTAAQAFAAHIERTFGGLIVDGPHPGMTSLLQLERTSELLDPELKRFVDRQALAWRRRTPLPARASLPAGDYLVNNHPIRVTAGETVRIQLPMKALGATGFAALQVSRLEFSAGSSTFFSRRVDNLRPSLDLQLAVTQPVRRALVGVLLDWSVRSYVVDPAGPVTAPGSVTLGGRLGLELMVGGPLAIRPSLGYRYGYLPGIELACATAAGTYACAPPDEGPAAPDALIYARGRAHVPFGELAVDWRRAGRTTAAGLGVKLVVEEALGTLESPAEAIVVQTGEPIAYTVEDGRWSATGFRMLANFSFAF